MSQFSISIFCYLLISIINALNALHILGSGHLFVRRSPLRVQAYKRQNTGIEYLSCFALLYKKIPFNNYGSDNSYQTIPSILKKNLTKYNEVFPIVQCLVPILVATKMTFMQTSEADGYLVVTPEEYARQAVDAIAICSITPGCVQHEIQVRGQRTYICSLRPYVKQLLDHLT